MALAAVMVGALLTVPSHATGAPEAQARVVRGIRVDGDLSDWPDDLPRYTVENPPSAYGGARIDGPQDLSASFRVAYDPDAQRLLLAVEVRDDASVVGFDHKGTDACEIYLQADLGRDPQQFVLVPGAGHYGTGRNPKLPSGLGGAAQAAFSRTGDTTTYEWSLPVPEDGGTARLRPGDVLLFDVVIVDKDPGQPPAWVPWGSRATAKAAGPDRVGRLRLLEEAGGVAPSRGDRRGGLLLLAVVLGSAILVWRVARGRRLDRRLAHLEQRVTDVQEVVLALSEQLDKRRQDTNRG